MHDKPWLLLEELEKLIDFYKQAFGVNWQEVFVQTVKVNLTDQGY